MFRWIVLQLIFKKRNSFKSLFGLFTIFFFLTYLFIYSFFLSLFSIFISLLLSSISILFSICISSFFFEWRYQKWTLRHSCHGKTFHAATFCHCCCRRFPLDFAFISLSHLPILSVCLSVCLSSLSLCLLHFLLHLTITLCPLPPASTSRHILMPLILSPHLHH